MYAVCELGYDKLLEKLLEKGADPNAREAVSIINLLLIISLRLY